VRYGKQDLTLEQLLDKELIDEKFINEIMKILKIELEQQMPGLFRLTEQDAYDLIHDFVN